MPISTVYNYRASQFLPSSGATFYEWEFFYSGIFWIPFCLILFWLFREHMVRARYPQYFILLLMAVGASFRCAWFCTYFQWGYTPEVEAINRIAILMQFSAFSLLILMWCRALKLSTIADSKMDERPTVTSETSTTTIEVHLSKDSTCRLPEDENNRQVWYHRVTILINLIAWGLILGTIPLAEESYTWYNVNIILITFLCLVEAVVILAVGITVGFKLRDELTPTYQSANPSVSRSISSSLASTFGSFTNFYRMLYGHDVKGLRIQREVLRTLMRVSSVASFCFILRSLAFLYRPVIQDQYEVTADSTLISAITYPFFFYQLPDLVPTLMVAYAISPPQGLLRVLRDLVDNYCCHICDKKHRHRQKKMQMSNGPLDMDDVRESEMRDEEAAEKRQSDQRSVGTRGSMQTFLMTYDNDNDNDSRHSNHSHSLSQSQSQSLNNSLASSHLRDRQATAATQIHVYNVYTI